jgi:hypothetical protein
LIEHRELELAADQFSIGGRVGRIPIAAIVSGVASWGRSPAW